MSATVHAIDNQTGITYGPGLKHTHADLDNLMCHELGIEPDAEKFLCNWLDNWGYMIAMNMTKQAIEDHMAKHFGYWREKGENLESIDKQERVWKFAQERFTWFNNWGTESNWKQRTARKTRKTRKAVA